MTLKRDVKLYTGAEMPLFGLGTWKSEPNKVGNAVKIALDAGYRHIDCAYVYENEKEIGEALKSSSIPRKEIFITSKLWNTFHRPDRVNIAINKTLSDLQLDYLDLYLVHWPFSSSPEEGELFPKNTDGSPKADKTVDFKETWKALEALVEQGKVKHIGISNFNERRIKELLSYAKIRPAVLQVELHPYLPQHDLVDFCKKENIHVTAYSPLGSTFEPRILDNTKLNELAKKYNTDPAHIALAWSMQRGITVIPKSTTEERIRGNFEEIVLEDEDMKIVSSIKERHRFCKLFPVFD